MRNEVGALMGKHTSGPWVYLDLGEIVLESDFDVTIATIDYGRERAEADGNLMAAAPELLEAAKACLAAEEERRAKLKPGAPATTYCEQRIATIKAAIAKAEGGATPTSEE